VGLMPVSWHGVPPADANQVVVPPSEEPWFEADQLTEVTLRVHGVAGATCADCSRWRWMPLEMSDLPRPGPRAFEGNPDVVVDEQPARWRRSDITQPSCAGGIGGTRSRSRVRLDTLGGLGRRECVGLLRGG